MRTRFADTEQHADALFVIRAVSSAECYWLLRSQTIISVLVDWKLSVLSSFFRVYLF